MIFLAEELLFLRGLGTFFQYLEQIVAASTSIFLKVCPACADQVPTDASNCPCGHDFESNASAPEESTLRDEELYENYLVARAEQARQSADAALRAMRESPADPAKVAEADLAREVAHSIDVDLEEQRNKIKALRRLVELKNRRPATIHPVHSPAPTELAEIKSVEPVLSNPIVETEPESIVIVDVPAQTASVPSRPTPQAVSPAASAEKAAQVLSAIKKAKVKEEQDRARKSREAENRARALAERERAQRELAEQQAQKASIEISTEPSEYFRQEQTARADLAMQSIRREDRKDCPNCTARVPLNTTRCSCGFAFVSAGNDLPTLTLCTGDFTALRNSLNLNVRRS